MVILTEPRRPPSRTRRGHTGSVGRTLPVWPIAGMFLPYLLWWVLGVGTMIWPIFAVPMVYQLLRRGEIRAPRGFGVWLLFMCWVCASVVEIDTSSRLLGFIFRLSLYAAATVTFVYVYNCDNRRLPIGRIAAILTVFWLFVVLGGYLGLVFPHVSISTPMSHLVPKSLQTNELVAEMIRPSFTQGDPDGYFHFALRPSAPFKYTNEWGTNFSLLLPFVFVTLAKMRKGLWFWMLAVAVPFSLVPAYSTQNRGMLLALGLGVTYLTLRLILRGHASGLVLVVLFALMAGGVASVVGVQSLIEHRVGTGNTNATRIAIYDESFSRTLRSPILGYGAPRPSDQTAGAPSAGTQGQFWLVLFSQGFVGVSLFMLWFLLLCLRSARPPSTDLLWLHAVLVMMTFESLYYGMMGSALIIAMIAGAVCLRPTESPLSPSGPTQDLLPLETAR